MKLMKQIEPDDCLRTCVACILDCKDPSEVPHIFHLSSNTSFYKGISKLDKWLNTKGLSVFQFSIGFPMAQEHVSLNDVWEQIDILNHSTPPFIVTGETHAGGVHAIVMHDDGKIWDPSKAPYADPVLYPFRDKEGPANIVREKYFLIKVIIPAWQRQKPLKIGGKKWKKLRTS